MAEIVLNLKSFPCKENLWFNGYCSSFAVDYLRCWACDITIGHKLSAQFSNDNFFFFFNGMEWYDINSIVWLKRFIDQNNYLPKSPKPIPMIWS